MNKNYDYKEIFDGLLYKEIDYKPLPMTESLYWRRVDNLRRAMINAEDFDFRLIFFHKLQELLRLTP